MKKNANLAQYFAWTVQEVLAHGTEATRTIIYCQTIKQCANSENREPHKVVIEMLHSCTPASNKENILRSFQKEQGYIRILVATIARRCTEPSILDQQRM